MRTIMSIAVVLFFGFNLSAQDADDLIKSGNDFYKGQEFVKAAVQYTKVVAADPANTTAKYNLANALFKQDKKVEAAVLLNDVVKSTTDKALLSKVWYNKGVILSSQNNLEESIEAYKNALRNKPDDKEARENLQKAMLEQKKKKSPKKQDDQQKKKQHQEQQKQQSKMSLKEAEQRLKLLQQKEKEVQQRIQKDKARSGGSQPKDW